MAKQPAKVAKPLPIFIWSGTDAKGNKKNGEFLAKNVATARAELRKQGIRVTKIKAKPKDLFGPKKQKITTRFRWPMPTISKQMTYNIRLTLGAPSKT